MLIHRKKTGLMVFFGISGFSLCCVANYDSARVELYLGKAKKEDNKKAFDAVIFIRMQLKIH